MTDPRHRALLDVVKTLPSDFAPWGERSREEEWAPDCSCGCRWYVRLEPGLQLDWGVCRQDAGCSRSSTRDVGSSRPTRVTRVR